MSDATTRIEAVPADHPPFRWDWYVHVWKKEGGMLRYNFNCVSGPRQLADDVARSMLEAMV
jgi:hypothetical protein